MEEKEVKIQVPEGYEIDEENSTFECIKFKKKTITLKEIFDKSVDSRYNIKIACSTAPHMRKINAINNLLIVAKYFNNGWIPDFTDEDTPKYYLYIKNNKVFIDYSETCNMHVIYFKSFKLAQQAIEILGKETIKQALSNDY